MIMRKCKSCLQTRGGVLTLVEWAIPLSDLDYDSEELIEVQRVVASKWLSMGAEVQAFEREFTAMHEARHALAVANASAGLHLAFLALGLGCGDEIIQPALNFVAAASDAGGRRHTHLRYA
jgi:dTDP-4-amino-4,6-dideoxygalactose transaminase